MRYINKIIIFCLIALSFIFLHGYFYDEQNKCELNIYNQNDECIKGLKSNAEAGNVDAMLLLAENFENKKEHEKAIDWRYRAASSIHRNESSIHVAIHACGSNEPRFSAGIIEEWILSSDKNMTFLLVELYMEDRCTSNIKYFKKAESILLELAERKECHNFIARKFISKAEEKKYTLKYEDYLKIKEYSKLCEK